MNEVRITIEFLTATTIQDPKDAKEKCKVELLNDLRKIGCGNDGPIWQASIKKVEIEKL